MQVLLGLQSNALKFTRKGTVSIHVEIIDVEDEVTHEKEEFLKIKVRDTGSGIPFEDQNKLFKLFGFLSKTRSMNKNGIGLGLVISQ